MKVHAFGFLGRGRNDKGAAAWQKCEKHEAVVIEELPMYEVKQRLVLESQCMKGGGYNEWRTGE
jgi:hypothetical protein